MKNPLYQRKTLVCLRSDRRRLFCIIRSNAVRLWFPVRFQCDHQALLLAVLVFTFTFSLLVLYSIVLIVSVRHVVVVFIVVVGLTVPLLS